MSSSPSAWITSSLSLNGNEHVTKTLTEAETRKQQLIPTHLFLHFDINETILLGDDAGGDSRNESAQKMLAKSAFCRIPTLPSKKSLTWEKTKELKPTHWWDGQEIFRETSMPPLYTGWEWPENCCPYYRTAFKAQAKCFTESHGKIYTPLLHACEAKIPRPSRDACESTSEDNQDEQITILPAFYETLRYLVENYQKNEEVSSHTDEKENDNNKPHQPPPFTIIFRTFGSDLANIASVVTDFAQGKHPSYPDINFPPLCLRKDRLYQGRWKVVEKESKIDDDNSLEAGDSKIKAIYQLWTYDESELVASGDSEILELLSGRTEIDNSLPSSPSPPTIIGIRDDYSFWKGNQYSPIAGKPIWVPDYDSKNLQKGVTKANEYTPYGHHLLFDDNIHNLPDDGIACIRKEVLARSVIENGVAIEKDSSSLFETVDGSDIGAYHGINLVRVPTVEPVLNPRWYIQQIEDARSKLQLRLQRQMQSEIGR